MTLPYRDPCRTSLPFRPIAVLLTLIALLTNCATTTTSTTEPPPATNGPNNTLAYETEPEQLALVLRDLGPALSKNVVLMHGVHAYTVGPYNFRNTPSDTVLDRLANDAGLIRMPSRTYELLAPPEYRQLNALNLRAMIPANAALPSASVAIGADTPLFDAFALLSQAFNTTLIADNAVAAARAGELSLPDVNGIDAVEALLKSARLDQSAFRVEAGDNYLLFHAAGNTPRADVIANRASLTPEQHELLNRRINLRLPEPGGAAPTEIGAYASATTLGNVLATLSNQIGRPVTANPILYRFPINPCQMTNVTTETALKLLLNQWLAQDFVVDVRPNSLHIRPI